MRSTAEQIEQKRHAARTIRKGDRVRLRDGAFQGSETEVIELRGVYGVVKITLLGEREVEVELDRMEKVA